MLMRRTGGLLICVNLGGVSLRAGATTDPGNATDQVVASTCSATLSISNANSSGAASLRHISISAYNAATDGALLLLRIKRIRAPMNYAAQFYTTALRV